MTHPQSRASIILCLALLLGVACKDSPTMPASGKEVGRPRKLMTAEDSAAFLASQPASPGGATATAITSIALKSGDSIMVTITSNECSGNPETVKVYGVISGVVAAGSCAGGLVGTQVTMGPASGDGTINFTATHQVFGEGPPGNVSGADPDYTVGMNDGYGDTDFNDVVIAVHVISPPCPPVNDPIIDNPDFKARYDSLMRASRQTTEFPFGREWGMRGWINPSTMTVEIDWPTYTDNDPCHVTILASDDPRIPLTRIHSHVFRTGTDETIVCGVFGPYDPAANGGSLNQSGDWDNAAGQGDYIFTPEWIFKLRPNTPVDQRPLNPYRWKKGTNTCFSLQPVP